MGTHRGLFGGLTASLAIGIAGCSTVPIQPYAIDVAAIGKVEREVKRQLSVYQSRLNARPKEQAVDNLTCGNGSIDFSIQAVKLDIATRFDQSKGGGATATIPVGSGTVAPSTSRTTASSSVQELVFNLYPIPDSSYKPTTDLKGEAPLADVLEALRASLISGAKEKYVCVLDFDPNDIAHDPGHEFTFNFSVEDSASDGIELKLGILDLSATRDRKSAMANTITVSFQQANLPEKVTMNGDGTVKFVGSKPGVGMSTPAIH